MLDLDMNPVCQHGHLPRQCETCGLLNEIARLRAALARAEQAEAQLNEYKPLFDLMWSADMRGVEAWRAEHPGNDLVMPDRAKVAKWIVQKWQDAEAANTALRAALRVACEEIKVRRGPQDSVEISAMHSAAVRATDAAVDLATGTPRT